MEDDDVEDDVKGEEDDHVEEEEEDVEDDDAEEDRSQDATQLCASLRSRNARQHVTRASPVHVWRGQGKHFVKDPGLELTESHVFKFTRWVVVRLSLIPQERRVNQKETKTQSMPFKMLVPSSCPGPKPIHFINSCLI